jgi:hypothetical protein
MYTINLYTPKFFNSINKIEYEINLRIVLKVFQTLFNKKYLYSIYCEYSEFKYKLADSMESSGCEIFELVKRTHRKREDIVTPITL